MRKPVRITTPFPSIADEAKLLGISPQRARRIVRMVAGDRADELLPPTLNWTIKKRAKNARAKRQSR